MSSRRRKEGGQKEARMNRGADIFQVETADEKCQVKVMIGVWSSLLQAQTKGNDLKLYNSTIKPRQKRGKEARKEEMTRQSQIIN